MQLRASFEVRCTAFFVFAIETCFPSAGQQLQIEDLSLRDCLIKKALRRLWKEPRCRYTRRRSDQPIMWPGPPVTETPSGVAAAAAAAAHRRVKQFIGIVIT